MHRQLHSVVRLAIHDEGMENVYFGDGEELQALENRSNTRTQLQAWLKLEKAKKKAEKEENEKVEKSKKAKDEKEIDWSTNAKKAEAAVCQASHEDILDRLKENSI